MSSSKLMWLLSGIGSLIGGYIPTLWGASPLSLTSLLGGAIGTVVGIWAVFKISGY